MIILYVSEAFLRVKENQSRLQNHTTESHNYFITQRREPKWKHQVVA